VWTIKVILSLCLIALAMSKNARAMRKEEKEGKPDDKRWKSLVAGNLNPKSQILN
jgi:hypothetical protein